MEDFGNAYHFDHDTVVRGKWLTALMVSAYKHMQVYTVTTSLAQNSMTYILTQADKIIFMNTDTIINHFDKITSIFS